MSLFSLTLVLISAAMHAGWNLLVRDQRRINMFMGITVVSVIIFCAPLLLLEFFTAPVFSVVPLNIVFGGAFLAVYYFGMTHSYRGGDFTVAYPLSRALPVLLVAC
ncbi:MAG: hypothetical protein DCC52_18685, partial [Chloroflexi bacterium]